MSSSGIFGLPHEPLPGDANGVPDGVITPAGNHSEGNRSNKGRFNTIMDGLYRFVRKQTPTQGAMNYALETLGLVEFSPIATGIPAKFHFNMLEGGVVYQDAPAVLTSGLGGLVTGQWMLTPLYDPNTNTYGGVPISNSAALSQEFSNEPSAANAPGLFNLPTPNSVSS